MDEPEPIAAGSVAAWEVGDKTFLRIGSLHFSLTAVQTAYLAGALTGIYLIRDRAQREVPDHG